MTEPSFDSGWDAQADSLGYLVELKLTPSTMYFWTVRRSNILFSNIYDGEHRDDTLPELPIVNAVYCEWPKGELTARMSTPVTEHETFQPIELLNTPR